MKKIFIAVLAVAAMASCATDEIVNAPKGAAIGFDETFVDNAVRANDLVAGNFDFGVYGSVVNAQDDAGMIFTNQQVAADGTYSPVQYWIAKANYDFVAIAPYTNKAWTYAPTVSTEAENGTITFNNQTAAANQDLLFASATATTPEAIATNPAKVGFTFNHMLSRVKFSFKNCFGEGSNIKLVVRDVKVSNVHKTGTLAVAADANGLAQVAGAWTTDNNDVFEFTFGPVNANGKQAEAATQIAENGGSASTEHFYFIPADATYNVNFVVDLYQAGILVDTYTHANVAVPANLVKGLSYNIVAELTPGNVSDDPTSAVYPIEFTVNKVEDWANFTDVDNPEYQLPAQGN